MNDVHALSGAYAVDAVDDQERSEFEQHLAACADCQAEVAGFRATTEQLSALLVGAQPPERLREQILRDIALVRPLAPQTTPETAQDAASRGHGRTAPAMNPSADVVPISRATGAGSHRAASGSRSSRSTRWLAAAAAVVALGGGAVALHPWDRQSQVQVSVADRVLQAPDAQRYQQTVASGGSATVVRSKSVGKAVLVTENLSAAPSGKVYQLWLEAAGGSFVSAGLLPASGNQTVVLDGDASTALGAGISVEPTGGSAQPTTPPVALIGFA